MEFQIIKKSTKSRARLGIIRTEHGDVETPAFVPVGTQAVVKTLTSDEAALTGTQIAIVNTFHLHLKPGEAIIKKFGGLHKFMNWNRPLMSDSGGFQVFSLGFGRDLGVGKILKYFPGDNKDKVFIHSQPKLVKINSNGVVFKSPLDGRELFLGPKESIKIQEALGADIIFSFDECTPPLSSFDYVRRALERTHCWAKICLQTKKSGQALFGIIQGSKFKELRKESTKFIGFLEFDGFGIGGDLGKNKAEMKKILGWIIPNLCENKPRHLLGIGYPEDMENIIKEGIDTFDCIVPTHYARRGIAFGSFGRLDMSKTSMLDDKKSLDKQCSCLACQNYSRAYISHLVRANEITGLKLLTFHNLHFFNEMVRKIREKIKKGTI